MSFKSELTIGERTYRVLTCGHSLSRVTDIHNRPSSVTSFGSIELQIESTDDIYLWSKIGLPGGELLSGSVVFYGAYEEIKYKELFFEDAAVVDHSEYFNAHDDSPMTISLRLSARLLRLEGGGEVCKIENNWPMGD